MDKLTSNVLPLACLMLGVTLGQDVVAQTAFAWAIQEQSGSYSPHPTYAFNPFGSVEIQRYETGRYTVIFENFGRDSTGKAGSGGHVQVSAYKTTNICNIDHWHFQRPDFTIDISCYRRTKKTRPVDAQFTVMATFEQAPPVIQRMDIGTAEIDLLQKAITSLQGEVESLVERIRALEER